MNLSQELVFDRTIIKWMVLFLNVIVRILGKIMHINHSLEKDFRVFAICKFKGLGSIIQATPLIQTIRVNYPNAKIIFVTTESNQKLVLAYPEIDQVITLNDRNFFTLAVGFFPFIFRLISQRIDNYLDLEIYSNFSSLVTTLSMATNRFGYYLRSSHYRLGIYTHMMYYNIDSPIFQTYLQLIRAFPITKVITELRAPQFPQTGIVEQFALGNVPYVVINPNASDLRLERRWGLTSFTQLILRVIAEFPEYSIVLVGSPAEENYVRLLANEVNSDKIICAAGQTSIAQLFELIAHAKLVITNDSGPMHIAFSLQKITIGLFGPCKPEQYGFHSFAIPIYKKIYCSPCVHEFDISPCHGNNQCMQLIEVSEVFETVRIVLQNKFEPQTTPLDIQFTGNDSWVPGFVIR